MRFYLRPAARLWLPCLVVLLIVLTGPAARAGQTGEPPLPARQQALSPDTIQAIHRLFATKRQQRTIRTMVVLGGAGTAVGAGAAGHDNFFTPGDIAKMTGIGAGMLLALNYTLGDRYSRSNEELAVADFRAHHLSRGLRRKLKARYFQ